MQVCSVVAGNTAASASGLPFKPLGALAVTLVGRAGGLGGPRWIAKMVIQLTIQSAFDQCLLESQRGRIDSLSRLRPVAERLQQFGGYCRQIGRLGLRVAGYTYSLCVGYALNTKLLTGPGSGLPRLYSRDLARSYRRDVQPVGPRSGSIDAGRIRRRTSAARNFAFRQNQPGLAGQYGAASALARHSPLAR
jgi:hypothetical protein